MARDAYRRFRLALVKAANDLDNDVGHEDASLYWRRPHETTSTGPWSLVSMLDDAECAATLMDGIREVASAEAPQEAARA